MNETINLSVQDISVSIRNKKFQFLNCFILVGKSTTFRSWKNNMKPCLHLFKIKLHQKYSVVLFIVQKYNELNKFRRK